jgi:hypothetical protein
VLCCAVLCWCVHAQVVSPPFPEDLNKDPFFLLKGDIFEGETKSVREPTSVMVGFVRQRVHQGFALTPAGVQSMGQRRYFAVVISREG